MRQKDKIKNIIYDIYRDLYANSSPKGDFDKLVAEAEVDSEGRKIIPYMNYEIEQNKMDEIIDEHCNKNSVKRYVKDIIKANVYLGCSPLTKLKKVNNDE